ncbi:hypothetical protein [uncultured Desulfuromonas sp.]|uniref:hypothetical protein n=1 Tax=uncultured Desulfuromonas sp. TaxID=181013 RepID=UPI002AABEEB0|nr:hypothetical protein [uncultured Desulfuromonas sp.]
MLDGLDEERRPEFYGSGVDSRLLGDDNFMDKCLSGAGGMALHLTAQQLIETVSRAYHLDADLYFRSKLGTVPSPTGFLLLFIEAFIRIDREVIVKRRS